MGNRKGKAIRLSAVIAVVLLLTSFFTVPAFADTVKDTKETVDIPESILADDVKTTEKSTLVRIIKPGASDEVVYDEKYVFSGVALKSNITMNLFLLNESTGYYEAYADKDGKYEWTPGRSTLFIKNITLNLGKNTFLIVTRCTEKVIENGVEKTVEKVEYSKHVITYNQKTVSQFINESFNALRSLFFSWFD